MNDALKLAAACLLLLALCGCHKNQADTPVVNSASVGCATSLRYIVSAKEGWAAKTGAGSNDTPTWDDLVHYLPRGGQPVCPKGGAYTIGTMGELPKCSIASHNEYFLSLLQQQKQ